MPLPTHPILRAVAWLSASFLAGACSSADSRAQAALDRYQSATAAHNLFEARRALLELVSAKDDVPDYWVELGRLQVSMGGYGEAYYAFTRAYELNRSNPSILAALTQLALRTGDLGTAQARAAELEIVAPDDPWIKLTKGWVAVSESRFQDALTIGDTMLSSAPDDPMATILKARALLGLQREDDAAALLTQHVNKQPTDLGSLQLLAKYYDRKGDWANLKETLGRMARIDPDDKSATLQLVEAALRNGDIPAARQASLGLLQPDAHPLVISAVLDSWLKEWQSPQRLADAKSLGNAAVGQQRKNLYAAFLNRAGSPADAMRLVGTAARLPITAENAEANSILADAWLRTGEAARAKARFDAVLAFDAGNATALRGRTELELGTRNTKAAVADAQKLVSVIPASAENRLLLARAYAADGQPRWADRTLWTAFQEIPADGTLLAALMARNGSDSDAAGRLRAEFERQRDAKMTRGLL